MLLRTRRGFLRQAACAAVGSIAISNTLRDFRFINAALAQGSDPFANYKALVCVFLSGGNDCNNFIIPRGADYNNYFGARQNLAIPEASLQNITSINDDGHLYGFHPNCGELATLFSEQKLAILFNVGPLLFPTTRDQYQKRSVALPPQLFSHSDQVTHWQTSLPDKPADTGWGGRAARELFLDMTTSQRDAMQISLCTSIAGANTLETANTFGISLPVGENATNVNKLKQYHVSTSGAVLLGGVATNRKATMLNIARLNQTNLQERAYGDLMDRAIVLGDTLTTAIAPTVDTGTNPPWHWTVPFPNTTLGNQLKMIARLVAARGALGMKRQIFFASVGGYDTHTSQVGTTPLVGSHANLMNELSEAIFAFQRGIEQVAVNATYGHPTLASSVTGFTASDFGRTFPTNGQGSDHGWGSHHIVFGGGVKGKRTYGAFPALVVNGPNDTSTGRWIPSTSVDEYSATLASWFGVTNTDLPTVFPNLGRFANSNLGFML